MGEGKCKGMAGIREEEEEIMGEMEQQGNSLKKVGQKGVLSP